MPPGSSWAGIALQGGHAAGQAMSFRSHGSTDAQAMLQQQENVEGGNRIGDGAVAVGPSSVASAQCYYRSAANMQPWM